jgi:ATP synthase protein I
MAPDKHKPFRTVLAWQGGWTVFAGAVAGWLAGLHGAISAVLGGAIGMTGGLVFAWLVVRNSAMTADGILVAALKAEAAKVVILLGLLAAVLATYKNVVVTGLIGSFIVSVFIFAMAFFVRDI